MKKIVMIFTFAAVFHNIQAQTIIVNLDGTHSTIINNGTTKTIVNPDGTHSTIIDNGTTKTIVNPDGTHSTLIDNGTTKTIVNPDGIIMTITTIIDKKPQGKM
jgi:CDGSH-type Zn-finger protein